MLDDILQAITGSDDTLIPTVESLLSTDDDIDFTMSKVSPQTQMQRPMTLPISVIKRPDGVYDIAIMHKFLLPEGPKASIVSKFFRQMMYTADSTSKMSINIFSAAQPVDTGFNEVSLNALPLLISSIGAVHSTKADMVGNITMVTTSSASFFMLACKRLMFSQLGRIIISRPAQWDNTGAIIDQVKEYLSEVLLVDAVTKGFLTEEEKEKIVNGETVVLTPESVSGRSNITVV